MMGLEVEKHYILNTSPYHIIKCVTRMSKYAKIVINFEFPEVTTITLTVVTGRPSQPQPIVRTLIPV